MKKQLFLALLFCTANLYPAFNDIFLQHSQPSSQVDEQKVIAQLPSLMQQNPNFDEDGDTMFYVCCKYGYTAIAQALITVGKSVNERNKDGFLPIDAAAMAGHDAIVDLILAQTNAVIAPNEDGVTVLHWAAKRGRKNIVKKLLAYGINPDVATLSDKQTPLLWAASGGKDSAQRIRLASRDSITRPPVQDYVEIVQTLIAHGANVNHTTNQNLTPLHWALAYYNRDIARILIRHNAQATIASSDGLIPVTMIKKEGDKQMLAEIEMVSKKGICIACNQSATQKCSQCKLAYYCSAQCQRNSWAQHKSFCQAATTFEAPQVTVWSSNGTTQQFSSVSQALAQTNMTLLNLK